MIKLSSVITFHQQRLLIRSKATSIFHVMANMIPSDGAVDITTEHFKATRLEIVVMQVDNFQEEDEVSIPNEIIL